MNGVVSKPARPAGRGRLRFAIIGSVMRLAKHLPTPLRERVLDGASGSVSGSLPPFEDILRLVEAAGGAEQGKRWQTRLLADRPDLRAVRQRDLHNDQDGRLRARLYLPPEGAAKPSAAFVWVHGGAFIFGGLDGAEAHWPALELAASGISVLSVDYRWCIDHVHYPSPQDDVLTAWRWAVAHAGELGVTPDHLHLGGASAGACLVAGAILRLRDQGSAMPASVCLAYPVLEGDLPPPSASMVPDLGTSKVPADAWIRGMFANWAGDASWSDPYVAPASADLNSLPPTYVMTCARDALRRSSEPFAAKLEAAGVPVWQDILPQSEHAPLDRPNTEDGRFALVRLKTWLAGGVTAMRLTPSRSQLDICKPQATERSYGQDARLERLDDR